MGCVPALYLVSLKLGGKLLQLLGAGTLVNDVPGAGQGGALTAVAATAAVVLLLLLLLDPTAEVLIEAELLPGGQHHGGGNVGAAAAAVGAAATAAAAATLLTARKGMVQILGRTAAGQLAAGHHIGMRRGASMKDVGRQVNAAGSMVVVEMRLEESPTARVVIGAGRQPFRAPRHHGACFHHILMSLLLLLLLSPEQVTGGGKSRAGCQSR